MPLTREDAAIFEERVSEKARRLAERYGYLPYIVERYLELLGGEAEELLEANEAPMPETFRCNDYRITCDELASRLGEAGFHLARIPYLPHGFEVVGAPFSLGATHEYLKGYYYIQDPGSMLVGYLLEPRPSEVIFDMAAAPGGKASQALQLTRDSALLIAVEPKRERVRALRSNLHRLGFSSFVVVKQDAQRYEPPLRPDRVLLDAPSSGEGIIRKDPSRKRRTTISDLIKIHERQVSLLRKALTVVRPGGVVLYAACSTAVEEGEYVIHKVLRGLDDIRVDPLGEFPFSKAFDEYRGVIFDERVSGCGRLFPHVHGTEGFFVCRLRRPG